MEPDYQKILQGKIDYYSETKAAYQFAAEEYARQYHEWMDSRKSDVSDSLPPTNEKLSELKKMAENYCYITHDDKPTISQKGLELVILEAMRHKLESALQLLLKLSNKPHFLYVNEVKEIAKLIHEAANGNKEKI